MKIKVLMTFFIICLFLINCDVYASGKDVQANYKKSYNEEIVFDTLNQNTIKLEMDDLKIEVSSLEKNIDVILIKASKDANDYAKAFTGTTNNYYLAYYKNDKKINIESEVLIKTKDKVLNVYNNSGKLLEKSNEKISLNENDYFLAITDLINTDTSNYLTLNINNTIESADFDSNATIEVYNSKDVKISNTDKLGTNYKVIVTKAGEKTIYTIVTKGDTTGDARITLPDVTRLYHHYKGIENMPEAFTLAGDVATNNIINLNDITKIYHYYKGIITEL